MKCKHFEGNIQKFRIVTNGISYGPCPKAEDDGVTHEFRSAFGSKMEYRGKSLSGIVEEILGIEDLWVFGDIESHDDYNYIYCSVYYSGGCKSYQYIADEDDIEVGDYVLVPVGANGKETVAKVVEKKYFCVDDVPFPVEKTKHIIRKCEMKDLLAKLDELWNMSSDVRYKGENPECHDVLACGNQANEDKERYEKLVECIRWWREIDTQGMDVVKYFMTPVMEILGDDKNVVFDCLEKLPIEDLYEVSGCFEYVYKKFMTEDVWDRLAELEKKIEESSGGVCYGN